MAGNLLVNIAWTHVTTRVRQTLGLRMSRSNSTTELFFSRARLSARYMGVTLLPKRSWAAMNTPTT